MIKKVAVALSGGVDSGVAAAILVREGYKCAGFHMKLWEEPQFHRQGDTPRVSTYVHPGGVNINKCCSTESLEAARKTAHQLGIPFYTLDFSEIFKKKVVDYFLKEYGLGRTPNPCVVCNKFIKFGELLDYVRKLGFDYLATGHYARISPRRSHGFTSVQPATIRGVNMIAPWGCLLLLMGKDKTKDQSYFLYNLSQKQLARVMFPVGDYLKKEVIAMAKKWSLPVAERPESQEICFFPETDYRPFLGRQIPGKIIPGEVVDSKSQVIGRHYGLPLYTIGQRHGFIINSKFKMQNTKLIPPFYVIGKDSKKNQLIVGFGKEAERKEFLVKEVNWVNKLTIEQLSNQAIKCQVRIRHQGELLKCKIKNEKLKMVEVILEEPERGVAPGQVAVFYQNEEVLGGGIINLRRLLTPLRNPVIIRAEMI